jgi:hypothetical protein
MRQSARPVERPGVVLVFAILNIVLGALGAIIHYCGGAIVERGFGLLTSSQWVLPSGSTIQVPPFPSDALAVSIADLVIRLALFIALIFAGLGLLGMNAWARKLSIALSILGILWALAIPTINSLYLRPKTEKWEKDLLQAVRNQLKDQNLPPPNSRLKSPAMSAFGSLFMPSLVATYSIVMLGFMLRPQVAMAFTGQGSRQGTDLERKNLPLGGEANNNPEGIHGCT